MGPVPLLAGDRCVWQRLTRVRAPAIFLYPLGVMFSYPAVRHSPISSRLPAVVEEDHDHSPCQSETESPREQRNCGARGAERPLGAAFRR